MVNLAKLRKFHNHVKNLYLKKYIGERLLDLASGKGGDIHKWLDNKMISYVTGYDINEESVKEANRRLKMIKNTNKYRDNNAHIKFFVKDLSANILAPTRPYDIISSQFAFHYFFKNTKTIETILSTIDNSSKKGTILILSLFDGEKILSLPENYLQEQFYIKRITEKSIEVKINNTVLDKPEVEYIVTPKKLIKTLKKINFALVEMVSFEDLYQSKFNMTQNEKKLSFLNNIYVFVKI
jgi:mRNA (guanine-N7-)-methyltransferase